MTRLSPIDRIDGFLPGVYTRNIVPSDEMVDFLLDLRNDLAAERPDSPPAPDRADFPQPVSV